MIKFSRNPVRWILALALMPVAPFLVLWVANFGRQSAEKVWTLGMPVFLENPWMLVPLAAMGPALILGTLMHLFMRPVKDSSSEGKVQQDALGSGGNWLCLLGRHQDKTAYDHPAYKGGAHVVECERCERAMVNGENMWHPIKNTKESLAQKSQREST